MTGQYSYLVRADFTECAVWREAMGNEARLLMFADRGYCIDAPEFVPGGGMRSSDYGPLEILGTRRSYNKQSS
jgi:hypothetical protein